MRENITVFKLCEGKKSIMYGTASEIAAILNLSVSRIYEACDTTHCLKGNYRIYRSYVAKNYFELESIKTGEKYQGTADNLSKRLYVTKERIFSNYRYNTLLLNEFRVRWLKILQYPF